MPDFTTKRGPDIQNQSANPVEYNLLPNYRESYGQTGGHEIIEYAQVPWDKKDAFIASIMPDVAVDEGVKLGNIELSDWVGTVDGSGNLVTDSPPYPITYQRVRLLRALPEPHRLRPKYYAADAQVTEGQAFPVKDGSGNLAFKHDPLSAKVGNAVVQVTYRPLPYIANVTDNTTNQPGNSEILRYVTRRRSPSGKTLPLQGVLLAHYDDTGVRQNSPPETAIKIFPESHLHYTWYMVPARYVPRAATIYQGRVNLTQFDTSSNFLRVAGYVGTLLYLNVEVTPVYHTFSGTEVVDVTYHVLERAEKNIYASRVTKPIGWNHGYAPAQKRWLRYFVPQFSLVGMLLNPQNFWWPNVNPPQPPTAATFSAPISAGGNVHDYVDLHNLFKLDDQVVPEFVLP